jgi:hypothetical protein
VPAFLGVCPLLRCCPLLLLELLTDSRRKWEYDEIFESALPLHQHDAATAVELHAYWTPSRLLIAQRDLCLLGHAAMTADGSVVLAATSVDYRQPEKQQQSGAERPGFRRAHLRVGGFVIQALQEDGSRPAAVEAAASSCSALQSAFASASRCRVAFMAQCDLRGSLPAVLHRKLCERQPMQLADIRAIVNAEQLSLSQDYRLQLMVSLSAVVDTQREHCCCCSCCY